MMRMRETGALTLISAPRSLAADAMALESARHAAADVAPNAAHAVALAHDVMEKNVGGAWHGRSRERADDGVGGNSGLNFFGLEPAVENGVGSAREDFDGLLGVGSELAEIPPDLGEPHQVGGSV